MATSFTLNGKPVTVNVNIETPLLWVLRDVLGLTGTKYGCGIEVCRACTVHIDGQAEAACEKKIGEVAGRSVTTIEGLGGNHPLQKAWVTAQVPQCGYCQSGMIMSAAALLKEKPKPTDSDINSIKNVCVCGTYQRIRAAIHLAAGN